jgi:hypothetical protein
MGNQMPKGAKKLVPAIMKKRMGNSFSIIPEFF